MSAGGYTMGSQGHAAAVAAMIADDTPLWKLTAGEFRALVAASVPAGVQLPAAEAKGAENGGKWLVKGIAGLADLLGCGKTKAMEIKASGIIDEAVTQIGRSVVIDAGLALRLIRERGDHAPLDWKRKR